MSPIGSVYGQQRQAALFFYAGSGAPSKNKAACLCCPAPTLHLTFALLSALILTLPVLFYSQQYMSNKHVNHQHGLTTMNSSRPKSKLRKRANKAKAKVRKAPLLVALMEARYGKKVAPVKKARRPAGPKKLSKKALAKKGLKAKKAEAKKSKRAKK